MLKKIIAVTILLSSLGVFAHEGHDEAPGALKANHGGVVKSGKIINLEYVVKGDIVELYPASHEGKDLVATDVKLSAKAKLPKGKPEPVSLDLKNGIYIAKANFKGAYRIEFQVEAVFNKQPSTFKFQVEK